MPGVSMTAGVKSESMQVDQAALEKRQRKDERKASKRAAKELSKNAIEVDDAEVSAPKKKKRKTVIELSTPTPVPVAVVLEEEDIEMDDVPIVSSSEAQKKEEKKARKLARAEKKLAKKSEEKNVIEPSAPAPVEDAPVSEDQDQEMDPTPIVSTDKARKKAEKAAKKLALAAKKLAEDSKAVEKNIAPIQIQPPVIHKYAKTNTMAIPGLDLPRSAAKPSVVVAKIPVANSILEADDDDIFKAIQSFGLRPKIPVKVGESSKGKGKEVVVEEMEIETEKTPAELKADRKAAKKATKELVNQRFAASLLPSTSAATPNSLLDDLNSFQAAVPTTTRVVVEKKTIPKVEKVKSVKEKKAGAVKEKEGIKKSLIAGLESSTAAEILATKWLSLPAIKELEKERGISVKKGKFSDTEVALIKKAYEAYRLRAGLSEAEMGKVVQSKRNATDTEESLEFTQFYVALAKSLELRPLSSVYAHARRAFDPLSNLGPWSKEEDAKLRVACAEHGNQWMTISAQVGRYHQDCKDRWRNKLLLSENHAEGNWTEEEENLLRDVMTKPESWDGKSPNWTAIALLVTTRNRDQIRLKWTNSLQRTQPGDKSRVHTWTRGHSARLIRFGKSQKVKEQTEIDFKKAEDPEIVVFGSSNLQVRLKAILKQAELATGSEKYSKQMKWAFKHYEDDIHCKILSRIRAPEFEKARLVKEAKEKARKKVYASAEFISASDEEDEE